jgi:hypothetical protein
VANADGTFINLAALASADWTIESEIDIDIDQPISECTVRLKRDISSTLSLSPLALRFDRQRQRRPGHVRLARRCGPRLLLETAVVAAGASPAGGDWKEMFRGIIDKVSFGQEPFEFRGRDLGCELADTWYAVKQTFTYTDATAIDIEDGAAGSDRPRRPRHHALHADVAELQGDAVRHSTWSPRSTP